MRWTGNNINNNTNNTNNNNNNKKKTPHIFQIKHEPEQFSDIIQLARNKTVSPLAISCESLLRK